MFLLESNSQLYQQFAEIIASRRAVFIAGVPGVGKSLYVQQLTMMAQRAGRDVTHFQWDVTRLAFETPTYIGRYPEIDGVTQPILRKAVGLWARDALAKWAETAADDAMMIGEVPLIGNRLIELVQVQGDSAEAFLRSEDVLFITVVPSREVRAVIEAARARSIANPANAKEKKDAPPNVLRQMWQEVDALAEQIGIARVDATPVYSPERYQAVFEHLLQHRHNLTLNIDTVFKPTGSVYRLESPVTLVKATLDEVNGIMEMLETTWSAEEIEASVNDWWRV